MSDSREGAWGWLLVVAGVGWGIFVVIPDVVRWSENSIPIPPVMPVFVNLLCSLFFGLGTAKLIAPNKVFVVLLLVTVIMFVMGIILRAQAYPDSPPLFSLPLATQVPITQATPPPEIVAPSENSFPQKPMVYSLIALLVIGLAVIIFLVRGISFSPFNPDLTDHISPSGVSVRNKGWTDLRACNAWLVRFWSEQVEYSDNLPAELGWFLEERLHDGPVDIGGRGGACLIVLEHIETSAERGAVRLVAPSRTGKPTRNSIGIELLGKLGIAIYEGSRHVADVQLQWCAEAGTVESEIRRFSLEYRNGRLWVTNYG